MGATDDDTTDNTAAAYALQDDEITALSSIYPGQVASLDSKADSHAVELSIPVNLPPETPTVLKSLASQMGGGATSSSLPSLSLNHLPSLAARVLMPPGYPLTKPPRVLSLRAPLPKYDGPGGWLSHRNLAKVQERLGSMWAAEREAAGEGAGVLWMWFDWICSSEFLTDLELLKDGTLYLPLPPALSLSMGHLLFKTHDAATSRADFEGTAHSCAICFEDRKGRGCMQLPVCGCVFCQSCLSAFWSLAIQEGTLANVACPSVDCVRARAARPVEHAAAVFEHDRSDGITAGVVESVVGADLARRWHTLSAKRLIDTNPEYTFCPRESCQAPVPPSEEKPAIPAPTTEPERKVIRLNIKSPITAALRSSSPARGDSRADLRWDNFRTCLRCRYAFCMLCRATWHGAHTPCAIRDRERIVHEYLEADDKGRAVITKRLGPSNTEALLALVRDYELEQLMKTWMRDNTTACPSCHVNIQKSEGCNHMTCERCRTHFCYRCGQTISASQPYAHFRDASLSCFNKLFDYNFADDHWVPFEAPGL